LSAVGRSLEKFDIDRGCFSLQYVLLCRLVSGTAMAGLNGHDSLMPEAEEDESEKERTPIQQPIFPICKNLPSA
jgi:hypothetical protein